MDWAFDSPRGRVDVRCRRSADGDPEVRSVAVSWKAGGVPATITFATPGPGRIGATSQGLQTEPRVLASPVPTRASLVAADYGG